MKVIKELEHLSNEDRLPEFGMFSLEKAPGRSLSFISTSEGGTAGRLERHCLEGPVVRGQGAMVRNWSRGGLGWT